MRRAAAGTSTGTYRVVDWREWIPSRVLGVAVIALFVAMTAMMVFLLARADTTAEAVPSALLTVALLVVLGKYLSVAPRAWRSGPFPLVEVDERGIRVRVDRYGRGEDGRRGRCVDLAWSEINGVGVGDIVPPASPCEVRSAAARAYLADRRLRWGREPGPYWDDRGTVLRGPMVLVAVGLQPWSVGQAAEFEYRIAAVRRAVQIARDFGRRERAAQIGVVGKALEHWQQEWAAVAQPVGITVIIPRRCLDRDRFEAAVRAFAPWQTVRELGTVAPSVQDSPHDLAARFGWEALY